MLHHEDRQKDTISVTEQIFSHGASPPRYKYQILKEPQLNTNLITPLREK